MRMSRLFGQTLRNPPSEAEAASHSLLLRAGFIRQLSAGVFTLLPLGYQTISKIAAILREEMNAIGGQEMLMPVVLPAELWKESGRWNKIDAEMVRILDRTGREHVLALSHEEPAADLVRREVQSYRQLPLLVYHIQTKFRDDPRPRAGLIRVREFTMKDSYSFDADWDGLERQYRNHYQAYFNIFNRCGLPVIAVGADVGVMGGDLSHEFMYLTPSGEDTLILCDSCGYAANRQIARLGKTTPPEEEALPLEKIATPDCKTIDELARYLDVPTSRTAKAVFMMATIPTDVQRKPLPNIQAKPEGLEDIPLGSQERFVFAIVRGDMEVNETKLARAIHARALRPAAEDEIRAVGAEPGYASPIGLNSTDGSLLVVVDDLVLDSPNLVAGANEAGYHLRNVNYERDYTADVVADITTAQVGDPCPVCGEPLQAKRGIEVGNIFQLGMYYSEPMDISYVDADGESKPVIMGSYGIGLGRLLASIVEEHHDEHGLVLPVTVAPYPVHLVLLAGREGEQEIAVAADQIYQALQDAGVETLYDDRDESPGVKFNDADLIGLPVRLTVSRRSLNQGGVEFKRRDQDERSVIPQEEVVERVLAEIEELRAELLARVVEVPYVA